MKRCLAVFTALLTAVLIVPFRSAAAEKEIQAQAYILAEASTGTVLAGENTDRELNCAYLSKLMSLLLIAEDIETGKFLLTTELTASQSVSGTQGAVIWLEPGDRLTVEELLKAVIIGNANDAMTVLAEASEKSVEAFVSRMNSEAFDMGLRGTAFFSPYGYYDEREHSTARDIAEICCKLARYETLRPYFRMWRDFVREGRTELVSENTLSRTYDRHIGFKACHSDAAGYCAAEGGMNGSGTCYIAVVLGAPDAETSLSAAKKLVNRGFGEYKVTATMFPDEMMKPMKVQGGTEQAVGIELSGQRNIVVPRGVNELATVTVLPEHLTAPVKKGQKIGTAGFYSGRELVCEAPIVAAEDVDELSFAFILRKTLLKLLK
ncbi:MAG: D-alanyl-D-alanine carboxypeptidase [Ruminococcus sp.]|nr:D-alanyl-D-alanine carboxypeptidase [Ruminococcus sp.]